jgi:hypothetical protein
MDSARMASVFNYRQLAEFRIETASLGLVCQEMEVWYPERGRGRVID